MELMRKFLKNREQDIEAVISSIFEQATKPGNYEVFPRAATTLNKNADTKPPHRSFFRRKVCSALDRLQRIFRW